MLGYVLVGLGWFGSKFGVSRRDGSRLVRTLLGANNRHLTSRFGVSAVSKLPTAPEPPQQPRGLHPIMCRKRRRRRRRQLCSASSGNQSPLSSLGLFPVVVCLLPKLYLHSYIVALPFYFLLCRLQRWVDGSRTAPCRRAHNRSDRSPRGSGITSPILLSASVAGCAHQAASMVGRDVRPPAQYCQGGRDDLGGADLCLHLGWVAWYTTLLPQPISLQFINYRAQNLAMKVLCLIGRSCAEVPCGPPVCLTVTSD